MAEELKGSRWIHLSSHDLELARSNGRNIYSNDTRIREREIAEFCGDCNFLEYDNTCRAVADPIEQGTRVLIAECNMAFVEGSIGKMTKDGFLPWRRKPR